MTSDWSQNESIITLNWLYTERTNLYKLFVKFTNYIVYLTNFYCNLLTNGFVSFWQNILLSFTNIFVILLFLTHFLTFILFFNTKKVKKLKNPIYVVQKQLYDLNA